MKKKMKTNFLFEHHDTKTSNLIPRYNYNIHCTEHAGFECIRDVYKLVEERSILKKFQEFFL